MKYRSTRALFTRQPAAARLGLALILTAISISIIGCPWFDHDDSDKNPVTPNIIPPPQLRAMN